MMAATLTADPILLFAYGSLREGERDHAALADAECLGLVATPPRYRLVDLGVYPALLEGGQLSVTGELYRIDRELRRRLDVLKECPILFQRHSIELLTGQHAAAYLMSDEQVRGRRRLHTGDWKMRFSPRFGPRR
jgi:gamma-glutamylaminecyclotransferase